MPEREGNATPPARLTHTVVSGDTLSGIAEVNGLQLEDLLRWNTLSNPDVIQVGHEINLYDPNVDFEYTVVEGDTVSALAERFGKRWVDIGAANRIDDINLIKVGQKLTIPAQGVARGR